MSVSVKTYTFNVIVNDGVATMQPPEHDVHVGDIVRWVTTAGTMRVVLEPSQVQGINFMGSRAGKRRDPVELNDGLSEPTGTVIEGVATIPGTYHHVAVVWQEEQTPTCAVGVLIIAP
jgi:hypothetical protein